MRHKAQIGMEYIIMFGFSLAIAGLIWIYASSDIEEARWELQESYANNAIIRITEMADVVYIQGPPAQFYITPTLPDNIRNVYIIQDTIVLEMLWKNNILVNISGRASVNLTGSISPTPGMHRILVRANNSNVEIRDE